MTQLETIEMAQKDILILSSATLYVTFEFTDSQLLISFLL